MLPSIYADNCGVHNLLLMTSLIAFAGWYVNLGDMAFWRTNPDDSEATNGGAAAGAAAAASGGSDDGGGGGGGGCVRDYFWQSRDSALLIKGGSNYAYEQIESELEAFAQQHFSSNVGMLYLETRGHCGDANKFLF